jgi:hypothetical protein
MNDKLKNILFLIDQYYNGVVNIAGLIQNIELHFIDFDSIEERNIFYALRNLDADIEITRFTIPEDKQKDEVKKHVEVFISRVT